MVEDIAIIFRRQTTDNGNEVFKPIKVVEGYYDENDDWFIDKTGIGYHHITDYMESGNVFACRQKIVEVVKKAKDLTFNELKKQMLIAAKKYIYAKSYANPEQIILIDTVTGKQHILKDMDSFNSQEKFSDSDENKEYIDTKENLKTKFSSSQKENVTDNDKIILTPKEIADKIKETIKGQDKAIDTIVTTIYLNRKYPELNKKNLLLIGPSGVGKTAIFQTLSKIINIPIVIISTAGFSQAGYVGRGTEEILESIYTSCNKDIKKMQNAIVILDEIDKIAYKGSSSGLVSTQGVQNELLKIIEGDIREIKVDSFTKATVDTTNITFVGLGAFSELYEEKLFTRKQTIGFNNQSEEVKKKDKIEANADRLVNYGLKRELVGRLPVIIELNNLSVDNLKDIIINSKESELLKIINIFRNIGIECTNIDFVIDLVAKDAINRKIGARGIVSTVTNIFMDIFYQVLSEPDKYSELIIGENILTNKKDYILVKKEVLTKKLTNN